MQTMKTKKRYELKMARFCRVLFRIAGKLKAAAVAAVARYIAYR